MAAKYFLLEEQEKQKEELAIGKERGNLDFLLNYLERATHGGQVSDNRSMLTVVENGEAVMSVEFVQNPYTQKWKIESL
ncbi:MAG: hypothetical protein A3J31_01655 [Candidatus Taylorbacteria bacterium RIFCSPLOWO2_02_FULL_48_16]|nr:MAG: hypothetical protein A3J31_01655 [Candidatus Taylorbacteria bacterium RIFCSPLOWO2_02_FULL_48_16]